MNCGVELAKTEKVCPLCQVEVQNPKEPWEEPKVRHWPSRVEVVVRRADRRFIATVLSVLLLVPVLICIVNDMMLSGGITWSAYVISGALVLWVMVVLPNFYKRSRPYLWPITSGAAVLALLYAIDRDISGASWFFTIGLPLVVGLNLFILFFIYWFRKKRQPLLLSMALLVISAGVYTVLVEIVLSVHKGITLLPSWSWYTLISCALMGAVLLILNSRRSWREGIQKRFYY